jgi:hypothetical protein
MFDVAGLSNKERERERHIGHQNPSCQDHGFERQAPVKYNKNPGLQTQAGLLKNKEWLQRLFKFHQIFSRMPQSIFTVLPNILND